jgi:hypothetical protein
MPDSTSILSAAKVTGKTRDGLSVGILQSVTAREEARISFGGVEREVTVEPTTNYFVGRLQKDWAKGNTVLGGMLTHTHRWNDGQAPAILPADAVTGALDVVQYFANRSYVLEGKGAFSRISGDRTAVTELQRSPVHYYQRPDADHLTLDTEATSLTGHAGAVRFARYGNSKWRWGNQTLWTSPGFDLNDVGFLRQADFILNTVTGGYVQSDPAGPFRQWSVTAAREDAFDFGGMPTDRSTIMDASGVLHNKWTIRASIGAIGEPTDTRLLRGGPSMKKSAFWGTAFGVQSDPSRRVVIGADMHRHFGAEADTHEFETAGTVRWRATERLVLQGVTSYARNLDDLQYVDTAVTTSGPRYLLGRIDQDTLAFTFRADVQLSPDLTIQYYGSPFVSNGRYGTFKRVTEPHASVYTDRFDALGEDEISFDPDSNRYSVTEGGATYSFPNPDFSFREYRSNLVTRWEFKPGSTLYVVWSQDRTSASDRWDQSLGHSFDRLWAAPPTNVFLVKFSYWLSI